MHTCTHTNTQSYMYLHIYIHIHIYIHTYTYIHIHTYKHTYIRTYIHDMYIWLLYACVYVCMHVALARKQMPNWSCLTYNYVVEVYVKQWYPHHHPWSMASLPPGHYSPTSRRTQSAYLVTWRSPRLTGYE